MLHDASRSAVIAAERELAAAHPTLDRAVLDRLLHRDYVIIQPDGSIETKAEIIESFATGDRRWDMAAVDQLDLRLYAGAAVVVGRWRAAGRNGDVRFDYAARFLSLWMNEDGRWQNVAYQSTEIPVEGAAPRRGTWS